MWAEYLGIMRDPAHLLAELTIELGSSIVGVIIGAVWVRRHDRRHHAVDRTGAAGVDHAAVPGDAGSAHPAGRHLRVVT